MICYSKDVVRPPNIRTNVSKIPMIHYCWYPVAGIKRIVSTLRSSIRKTMILENEVTENDHEKIAQLTGVCLATTLRFVDMEYHLMRRRSLENLEEAAHHWKYGTKGMTVPGVIEIFCIFPTTIHYPMYS